MVIKCQKCQKYHNSAQKVHKIKVRKIEANKIKANEIKANKIKTNKIEACKADIKKINTDEIFISDQPVFSGSISTRGNINFNNMINGNKSINTLSNSFMSNGVHTNTVDFSFTFINKIDGSTYNRNTINALLATLSYHPKLVNSSNKDILVDVLITPSFDWSLIKPDGSVESGTEDPLLPGNFIPVDLILNSATSPPAYLCPPSIGTKVFLGSVIKGIYNTQPSCFYRLPSFPIPPTPEGQVYHAQQWSGSFLSSFLPFFGYLAHPLNGWSLPLDDQSITVNINIKSITFELKVNPADVPFLTFAPHSDQDHTIEMKTTSVTIF